jgi:uncharacterized protein YkwD
MRHLGVLALLATMAAGAAMAVTARAPIVDTAKAPVTTKLEADVLDQINGARTNPAEFAKLLPRTPGAATEASSELQKRQPAPPLTLDERLAAAARKHAAEQGGLGGHSHIGVDGAGPMERMRREGVWSMLTGEEMSLGQTTAKGVVIQLIVDEGSRMRAHRSDLMNPLFTLAGVGCAPHTTYRTVCVIDLSGAPMER